jgi:hypothetical protein
MTKTKAAAFFIVRKLTLCWTLTALPGIPPAENAIQADSTSELPALADPATFNDLPVEIFAPELDMPGWDGASRINIAFFGLRGDTEDGYSTCADTIMILTVDPVTKTAGMLSKTRITGLIQARIFP